MDLLRDIYERWIQKLILRISAFIDRRNDVVEEEQALLGKTESDLHVV